MNDEERLSRLKERIRTVMLRGKCVEEVVEKATGHPGLFLPPMYGRTKTVIELKTGRSVVATLFTLCHELGHFWSYASGQRTARYDHALARHQDWEGTIILKARNSEAMMAYAKPADAPREVLDQALAVAEQVKPNPLSEDERRLILDEEIRAWCFGIKIAEALGCDLDNLATEANGALRWYYLRLKLREVPWAPTDCSVQLTGEDRQFVAALTAA